MGTTHLEGVTLCYRNCATQLIVSGDLSFTVRIESSVKQGCPMYPLLFTIYPEPPCLSVLTGTEIHGYRLLGNDIEVLAYADDVDFFFFAWKSEASDAHYLRQRTFVLLLVLLFIWTNAAFGLVRGPQSLLNLREHLGHQQKWLTWACPRAFLQTSIVSGRLWRTRCGVTLVFWTLFSSPGLEG